MTTTPSLHTRAADMLVLHVGWSSMADATRNNLVALIAELRAAAQQSALDELVRENERLGLYDDQQYPAPSSDVFAIVYEQANDDGLWFRAQTAPEAYLQQELRRLHAAIEAAPAPAQPRKEFSPTNEDANNYCRILSLLGMEEEGDPVAQVERDAADAARYRWLRANGESGAVDDTLYVAVDSASHPNQWAIWGAELDAAIDAAKDRT